MATAEQEKEGVVVAVDSVTLINASQWQWTDQLPGGSIQRAVLTYNCISKCEVLAWKLSHLMGH